MLSNAERSAALAAFKTLALHVAGDGVTINTAIAVDGGVLRAV